MVKGPFIRLILTLAPYGAGGMTVVKGAGDAVPQLVGQMHLLGRAGPDQTVVHQNIVPGVVLHGDRAVEREPGVFHRDAIVAGDAEKIIYHSSGGASP